MAHNRGTRRKPDWCGVVSYRGKRKWVGGCKSMSEYDKAAERVREELREQVEKPLVQRTVPTVSQFAGAELLEDGRIAMVWPDGQRSQKAEGRTPKTVLRLREGLRPFLREFWDRPLDSFNRDDALTWILPRGPHVQQSVRQFFNHAHDRELIVDNKFARPGASKRKRRVDRHDFAIVTDEQYAQLRACARRSCRDDYGLVIEGIVLTEGEAAMRPSEIFALHEDEIDFAEGIIHVHYQYDSITRKRVAPKDHDPRWVVMSHALQEHLERMPRYSPTILFPAIRGGYYTLSNFYSRWHAVRVAAGMPALEFYELKHRALQWMVDPVEDGGLGLDHQTAAAMAGHDDGGWLISNVYTKLAERRARERAKRAMHAYRQRHTPDTPRLQAVNEYEL
jgi:integrase